MTYPIDVEDVEYVVTGTRRCWRVSSSRAAKAVSPDRRAARWSVCAGSFSDTVSTKRSRRPACGGVADFRMPPVRRTGSMSTSTTGSAGPRPGRAMAQPRRHVARWELERRTPAMLSAMRPATRVLGGVAPRGRAGVDATVRWRSLLAGHRSAGALSVREGAEGAASRTGDRRPVCPATTSTGRPKRPWPRQPVRALERGERVEMPRRWSSRHNDAGIRGPARRFVTLYAAGASRSGALEVSRKGSYRNPIHRPPDRRSRDHRVRAQAARIGVAAPPPAP